MDDDDRNMESNYSQVMREEYISKKIGMILLNLIKIPSVYHLVHWFFLCFRYNGRFRRYENGSTREEKESYEKTKNRLIRKHLYMYI